MWRRLETFLALSLGVGGGGGGATGIQQVEDRDPAKYPTAPGITPHNKEFSRKCQECPRYETPL